MDRRRFLAHAAAPLLLHGASLYAAPAADTRLLVVFMRGAYDCANLLVPATSEFYYESRPNIAIPRDQALPLADRIEWTEVHAAPEGDTRFPAFDRGQNTSMFLDEPRPCRL